MFIILVLVKKCVIACYILCKTHPDRSGPFSPPFGAHPEGRDTFTLKEKAFILIKFFDWPTHFLNKPIIFILKTHRLKIKIFMVIQDKRAFRVITVAVIGGGASGCMAAIAAARAGADVHIFEKNDLLARKIYATGNGRCNLTNLFLDRSCYHAGETTYSQDRDGRSAFVKDDNPAQTGQGACGKEKALDRVLSMIERFSQKDLIRFFENEGVLFHDRDGYVYPRTDQAETIAKAFEKCIRSLSIEVHTCCEVKNIQPGDSQDRPFRVSFAESHSKAENYSKAESHSKADNHSKKESFKVEIKTVERKAGKKSVSNQNVNVSQPKNIRNTGRLQSKTARDISVSSEDANAKTMLFDAVILSCGGLAGPSFGCSGDGYRLAKQFSHPVNKPLPALTQLVCKNDFLKRAAGVRCQARVMLVANTAASDQNQTILQSEEGELQITDYGISGIPVFQLSSLAARLLDRGERVFVQIDFLPELTKEAFQKQQSWRLGQDRDQTLQDFFLGLAHKKVIDFLLACTGRQAEMKAKRLTEEELCRILGMLCGFTMEVLSARSFENAQVTSGGIPLDEVDDGLQSLHCPGLFFAGELLDVDGRCGGYNLQWAMTSGMIAGAAAAGSRRCSCNRHG